MPSFQDNFNSAEGSISAALECAEYYPIDVNLPYPLTGVPVEFNGSILQGKVYQNSVNTEGALEYILVAESTSDSVNLPVGYYLCASKTFNLPSGGGGLVAVYTTFDNSIYLGSYPSNVSLTAIQAMGQPLGVVNVPLSIGSGGGSVACASAIASYLNSLGVANPQVYVTCDFNPVTVYFACCVTCETTGTFTSGLPIRFAITNNSTGAKFDVYANLVLSFQ